VKLAVVIVGFWLATMMLGLWGYGLDGLAHSLTDTDELASTVVAWLLFAGPPFLALMLCQRALSREDR
jgi:hypothetical protein